MKQSINPIFGAVVVAIVLGVALYFGIRSVGPTPKSHEPVDMSKLMGKAPIAPPSVRPSGPPTGQAGR